MSSVDKVNRHDVDNSLKQNLLKLCDDAEFNQLESELKVFNPFRVLKVERYELRHTTALAWLLNPHESHGMGDIFLQCFLRQVAPAGEPFWATVNTSTAEVLAELVFDRRNGFAIPVVEDGAGSAGPSADRLDVLVEGRNTDSSKWCVAIEAKIDSNQGERQLERYDSWLTPNFSGHNLLKLYLTVEPEANIALAADRNAAAPDSPAPWVNILWGDHVAKAMDEAMSCLERKGKKPDDRVRDFLVDYRELLSGLSHGKTADLVHRVHAFANRTGVNAVMRTLKRCIDAKKVVRRWDDESWVRTYWEHRSLLDMCTTHVRSVDSAFLWERVVNDLACDNGWHIITPITSKNARITFVPTSWLTMNGVKTADNRWNLYYHAEFRNFSTDVEVKLYLPKTGDREAQRTLLGQLFSPPVTARPSDYLKPDTDELNKFLSNTGDSLKLYTVSTKWERRADGTPVVARHRVATKDKKYQSFSTAVAAHTNVISALV